MGVKHFVQDVTKLANKAIVHEQSELTSTSVSELTSL